MQKYPKRIHKELKRLCDIAYKRELEIEIGKLAKDFDEWRSLRMDCFELNEHIHKFHDGVSREIWEKYNLHDASTVIAIAVVKDIIKKEEVSEETFEYIKNLVDNYAKLQ